MFTCIRIWSDKSIMKTMNTLFVQQGVAYRVKKTSLEHYTLMLKDATNAT